MKKEPKKNTFYSERRTDVNKYPARIERRRQPTTTPQLYELDSKYIMDNFKTNANKAFSAGLGKGGRVASWAVAIGGLAAYTYWVNRDNGDVFTKDEQMKWNARKEETLKKKEKE